MGGTESALEGGIRTDALLFGESQSRMLVSVRRKSVSQLRELARREDVPCTVLGEVRGHSVVIDGLIDLPIEANRERWRRTLERRVGG